MPYFAGAKIVKLTVRTIHTENNVPAAFVQLGNALRNPSGSFAALLQEHMPAITASNGWFTAEQVRFAISVWAETLTEEHIRHWLKDYPVPVAKPARVALILAGNIPLVGLHDILCVLASGHKVLLKTSSDDPLLTRLVISQLPDDCAARIETISGKLPSCDAVIATGNNTSARYFDYYFRNIPRILRKNRNSVAVLTGSESKEQLKALGEDIFRYYGLGCRNVSSLLVPKGYSFNDFFEQMYSFGDIIHHKKYGNNYDYHRALLLLNKVPFLDNHFLLLTGAEQPGSPVGVLHFREYENREELHLYLEKHKDDLQCIVSIDAGVACALSPGQTQHPTLNDYADHTDTMKFLSEL
jgi:hypothetical protein